MLLDLLGKKSRSLQIGICMNDLATDIKNVGLGITVEDHDPCGSIMHKSKTKLRFNNANSTMICTIFYIHCILNTVINEPLFNVTCNHFFYLPTSKKPCVD